MCPSQLGSLLLRLNALTHSLENSQSVRDVLYVNASVFGFFCNAVRFSVIDLNSLSMYDWYLRLCVIKPLLSAEGPAAMSGLRSPKPLDQQAWHIAGSPQCCDQHTGPNTNDLMG